MHTEKQGPKPNRYPTGHNPQPTDPSSSAFVQEGEWVLPITEVRDEAGAVSGKLADDFEPARTKP